MTNTDFIVREKSGINHLSFTPSAKVEVAHFGVINGALVLGFVVAFMSLVLLLAR